MCYSTQMPEFGSCVIVTRLEPMSSVPVRLAHALGFAVGETLTVAEPTPDVGDTGGSQLSTSVTLQLHVVITSMDKAGGDVPGTSSMVCGFTVTVQPGCNKLLVCDAIRSVAVRDELSGFPSAVARTSAEPVPDVGERVSQSACSSACQRQAASVSIRNIAVPP